MATIKKPDGMDLNDFSASVRQINASAVIRVEGRPNFICEWDESVSEVPTEKQLADAATEWRKGRLDNYARRLARDKRRAALGAANGIDDDVLQSEFLSLQGRAAAMLRRESAGRGKPGESLALDQLEAQADALGAIDAALEAVRAKIADGTYTTDDDINTAREWPQ